MVDLKSLFKAVTGEFEIVARSNSKGLMTDFSQLFATDKKGWFTGLSPADFSKEKAYDVILDEPIVKAAYVSIVDKVFEGGISFTSDNGKAGLDDFKKLAEKEKFELVLRQVVFNLLGWHNSFMEILTGANGKALHFNILDYVLTEPLYDDYRNPIGFVQNNTDSKGVVKWGSDEVVHFTLDKILNYSHSENSMRSLYHTIKLKNSIREYLLWFYMTHQNRPVLTFDVMTPDDVIKSILGTLKNARDNLEKPLVVRGAMSSNPLNSISEHEKLIKLMDMCDEQILMLLQVPPIVVGKNNESGRNESAELRDVFYTRVRSIQRTIELFVNTEVLPKAGYPNIKMSFPIVDKSSIAKTLEMVQVMRQSQFTTEAIQEMMERFGLIFETKKVFKTDEEIAMMSNKELGTGNESIKGNANKDAMPSRQRKGDVANNTTQNE